MATVTVTMAGVDEPAAAAAVELRSKREWEWEGRVVSPVPAATADEAWALLSDFLAFHRWHPRVAACRLASGTPLVPGCVRYCEGVVSDSGDDAPPPEPDWAHETLLEYDPAARFFRYEMNDNNMGFGVFFATFRVVPAAADGVGGGGCELRWEFECEPVRGTPRDALVARLQAGLDGMAARVRDHVLTARAAAAALVPPAVAGPPESATAAGELIIKLDKSIAV